MAKKPYTPIPQKKLDLFDTPGLQLEFDPEEADALGAFEETAISAEDAEEAATDAENHD